MSTTQNIIDQAIVRSQKNRPEWSAQYGTELRQQVARTLNLCYQMGHLLAPDLYGLSTSVAGVASVWSGAGITPPIYFVENASGARVHIVPVTDRLIDVGGPRLYWSGATLKSVGLTGDPTATESLTFWTLAWPGALADLSTAFDAYWPTRFDALLVEEMALYLALKDGREDEVRMLAASRDQWLQSFVQYLRSAVVARSSRFAPTPVPAGDVAAIAAGFLGGAKVG